MDENNDVVKMEVEPDLPQLWDNSDSYFEEPPSNGNLSNSALNSALMSALNSALTRQVRQNVQAATSTTTSPPSDNQEQQDELAGRRNTYKCTVCSKILKSSSHLLGHIR
jgi:hypothetical protein